MSGSAVGLTYKDKQVIKSLTKKAETFADEESLSECCSGIFSLMYVHIAGVSQMRIVYTSL